MTPSGTHGFVLAQKWQLRKILIQFVARKTQTVNKKWSTNCVLNTPFFARKSGYT